MHSEMKPLGEKTGSVEGLEKEMKRAAFGEVGGFVNILESGVEEEKVFLAPSFIFVPWICVWPW